MQSEPFSDCPCDVKFIDIKKELSCSLYYILLRDTYVLVHWHLDHIFFPFYELMVREKSLFLTGIKNRMDSRSDDPYNACPFVIAAPVVIFDQSLIEHI